MSKTKYKINYDNFKKLKAITLMTFEESKQIRYELGGRITDDYTHFISMQLLEADVRFLELVNSLFNHTSFTLYELRRELVVSWERGVKTKVLDETEEDRVSFVADMENSIKRCVELNNFKKVG